MKQILTLVLLAICHFSQAQEREVQISGRLAGGYSDTTYITMWSDGQLIAEEATINWHYALILGEKDHYTIRYVNGEKMKYCHILLVNMELEHIQVDVVFSSSSSVIVYKHKKYAKQYTEIHYSPRGFRTRQLDLIKTE